jgi:hypothetical protein
MPNGGRAAGFGLRYQYLATAEQVLSFLLEHDSDLQAIISPLRFPSNPHDAPWHSNQPC